MAAILTAVLLWGSSFSAMGIVLKDLDPMAAVFLRLLIASLCILPFAGRLIPRNWHKGDLKVLGAMVLCQPCLYFLFESRALIHTTSSQAGIVSACLPLMVALAARVFLGETLKPGIISGLALVGVVLSQLENGKTVKNHERYPTKQTHESG